MTSDVQDRLVKGLSEAHAMEKQATQLLDKGAKIAGDDDIAAIYRAHLLQTKEHERYIAERLEAHGTSPSRVKDFAMQAGALGIGAALQVAPATPIRLAATAYAFENLEIASYRLLRRIAERAGDSESLSVIDRILEQEEAAAELVAGTFDRALEVTLGEPAVSPVPPVTPLGRPSERGPVDKHPGPQLARETPPDEPVAQEPHVDTPH
jgi:ferritin-like metal-binding protein YciE